MPITKLPIVRRVVVDRDRDVTLVHVCVKSSSTGLAQDLSGYTFSGECKAEKSISAATLATIDFSDNDLANGVVKGTILAADSGAVVDGIAATDDGLGYWEIVATDSNGKVANWFEGTLEGDEVVVDLGGA